MLFINIAYASETAEQAAEAASDGVLASLGINGALFIFQLINFAIVAVILWFLILKPLTSKMAQRQKMMDESIENAKKIETNLMMSEKKYQEKVDEAKVEANKIVSKAREDAVKTGDEMKNKARKEMETLVEEAKRNIKREKEESIGEVKREAADLIVAAAEKLLSAKLDARKDAKLIEEAMENMRT